MWDTPSCCTDFEKGIEVVRVSLWSSDFVRESCGWAFGVAKMEVATISAYIKFEIDERSLFVFHMTYGAGEVALKNLFRYIFFFSSFCQG